jgi:hypothetical protein
MHLNEPSGSISYARQLPCALPLRLTFISGFGVYYLPRTFTDAGGMDGLIYRVRPKRVEPRPV